MHGFVTQVATSRAASSIARHTGRSVAFAAFGPSGPRERGEAQMRRAVVLAIAACTIASAMFLPAAAAQTRTPDRDRAARLVQRARDAFAQHAGVHASSAPP